MNAPQIFKKRRKTIVNYKANCAPLDALLQYERFLRKDEEPWDCKKWQASEGLTFAFIGSKVLAGVSYQRRTSSFGLKLDFWDLATAPKQIELGNAVVAASVRAEEIRSEYEPVAATASINTMQNGQFRMNDSLAYSRNGMKPHGLNYRFEDDEMPTELIMSATAEEMRMAQAVFSAEWAA